MMELAAVSGQPISELLALSWDQLATFADVLKEMNSDGKNRGRR